MEILRSIKYYCTL